MNRNPNHVSTPGPMHTELVVIAGARPVRLRLKLPSIIGRSDDARLKIRHGKISRRHCELRIQDTKFWIEDLQSSNGTFVNGRRLTEAWQLQHGDCIRIGELVFRFELVEEAGRAFPVTQPSEEPIAPENPCGRPTIDLSEPRAISETSNSLGELDLPDDDLPQFLKYKEQPDGSFVSIETGSPQPEMVTERIQLQTDETPAAEISRIGPIHPAGEASSKASADIDREALASFLKGLVK